MAARRSTSLCRATDGEVWRGKMWSQRTGGDAERESVMYRLRRVSESYVRARGVQRATALHLSIVVRSYEVALCDGLWMWLCGR